MFATTTKRDAKTVSITTLKEIRQAVNIPIVAIGGINTTTLPLLQKGLAQIKTCVDGVAVVSAILAADDISLASQRLKNQLKQ